MVKIILKSYIFQDVQIREAFHAYPEIMFIDATYKLLELGIPLHLFLCEDSNGQSEVVSVTMLVPEYANGTKWMMDAFKKQNS